MKIRTDFVTNSSSSSFVVDISVMLKDDDGYFYEEVGVDGEGNPTVGEIFLYASPRELGTCKTVRKMIDLLKASVKDNQFEETPKKLFDANDPEVRKILSGEHVKNAETDSERKFFEREKEAHEEAQGFIEELENIKDMDEIKSITISGEEINYERYYRSYTYDLETGEYLYEQEGEAFEKDGGSGGDLLFEDSFLAKGTYEYHKMMEKLPCVVPIEGTGYAGRSERIEHVKEGDKLILKADTDNEFYDPVAIEVFNEKNESLGYLQYVYSLNP